jgi:hypothetical protein
MPHFPPGVHLIGGRNAAVTNAELAGQFYAPIIPIVVALHNEGQSLRSIARELDRRGIRLRLGYDGSRWSATQVRRLLARAAGEVSAPALFEGNRKTRETPQPEAQHNPKAVYFEGTRETRKTPEAQEGQNQPRSEPLEKAARKCPADAQACTETGDRPPGGPDALRWERLEKHPTLLLLMAGVTARGAYSLVVRHYRAWGEGGWGEPQPIPADAPPLPAENQVV